MRIAAIALFSAVLVLPALADNDSVPRMGGAPPMAGFAPSDRGIEAAITLPSDRGAHLSGAVTDRLGQARKYIQLGNMKSALKETHLAMDLALSRADKHAIYGYQYYIYQKTSDHDGMAAVIGMDRNLRTTASR